jgi:hypothetical protein
MNKNLNSYQNNIYSQFGEDGIIQRIFETFPTTGEQWCVEFGAWDGIHLSNTHHLIKDKHWKGILIEGKKSRFKQLAKNFKNNSNVQLLNKFVSFEGENSLDKILHQTSIPKDFDLLSIDIDGNDYHVWDSLLDYRPKVVVIEFNPSIPSDIYFVQERKQSVNHGNSLLSMVTLAKSKGYELIATTKCNAFFVEQVYYPLFGIEDNSIKSMWKGFKVPRVFQLYDGTIVLSDEFKLFWSGTKVKKNKLQVLPKYLRFYDVNSSLRFKIRKFILKYFLK